METHVITSLEQYIDLWKGVYASDTGRNWAPLLACYDENLYFRDSVQEIRGLKKFAEMTARLSRRSQKLDVIIHNAMMQDNLIFVEWEMQISYKKFPKSSIYGTSRLALKNGKIADQRDYYDLWGDIFDNIGFFRKIYRRFMKKRFG